MEDITQEKFWTEAWQRHLDTYLKAPPRAGYWLERRFGRKISALELAGGSCRDSRYLATRGVNAIGTDFDQKTLAYLQQKFPNSPLDLRREDAFALNFPDRSVDLSFSNGFWILFTDNAKLILLAREQARVTRKWMVIIVHNAMNSNLRKTFAECASKDPLYDIRFFEPQEVGNLIRSSGISFKSISLEKFGGGVDLFYHSRLKGVPNPVAAVAPGLVPHLYSLQGWASTERIACVVELA